MPAELGDRHDDLWRSAEAVAQLLKDCRLDLPPLASERVSLVKTPWWARFDAVREAWCRATGLMHPRWADSIDYRRAREAGIDMSSSSRYRLRGPQS